MKIYLNDDNSGSENMVSAKDKFENLILTLLIVTVGLVIIPPVVIAIVSGSKK